MLFNYIAKISTQKHIAVFDKTGAPGTTIKLKRSANVAHRHVLRIGTCCALARVAHRHVLHIGTCCTSARVALRHVLHIGTCCTSARVAPSSTSGLYKELLSSQSWSVGHNKPESQHLPHCLLVLNFIGIGP